MSWPPTPDPPTSIEEAEAILRSGAIGPPAFGDDDPWDFVLRWPDDVIEKLAWPAISRLLEDDDPNVRERALRFVPLWPVGTRYTIDRLIEVATMRAQLFREASQVEEVVRALTDLCFAARSARPRVAKVILELLGEAPPCRGGVALLAEHAPLVLIERAKRWSESAADQSAAIAAVTAMAAYRRERLLELLEELATRSLEHRNELLADLEEKGRNIAPTLEECRRALGLGSNLCE